MFEIFFKCFNFNLGVDATYIISLKKPNMIITVLAAGSDEVPGELLEYGGETIAKLMQIICNNIWQNEKIPDEWKKSIIITIPKSEDSTECNNHRTISLINHASNVILEIIKNRMKKFIESNLSEYQAGFRIGRGTIDHIITIRQLAEHRLAKNNKDIYYIFIDFKKTFDRVCHKGLFIVLKKYGVPKNHQHNKEPVFVCQKCSKS